MAKDLERTLKNVKNANEKLSTYATPIKLAYWPC